MSASVKLEGFEELLRDLRNLPKDSVGEATPIVEAAANSAAFEVRSEYGAHRQTGALQDGVVVERQSSDQFGVSFRVRSKAPHAWLFDNGSNARHYVTASGARHETGSMWGKTPPTHVFVRTAIRKRRDMYSRLKAMLTRFGAEVSGDA